MSTTIEYDPIYDPFNPEVIADPYPFYARLRDEHPLHHNERMDLYVLSRYDDIFRALRKPGVRPLFLEADFDG